MFAVTNVDDVRNPLACDGLFLCAQEIVMEESESDDVVGSFHYRGESVFRSKNAFVVGEGGPKLRLLLLRLMTLVWSLSQAGDC